MELGESSTSIPPSAKRRRGNQFDGIMPYASSTSPAVMKKRPCDVFINFRGCDTRHTLATSIYHTLDLIGIHAFLDVEELQLGDSIPVEIKKAMDTAVLHIAIFSERYAESSWCLAELCYMLQTGAPIIPVFYHVDPSDLRWVDKGKGCYASAFSQHEEKGRYPSNMLHDWKMALQRASNLSGHVLNTYFGDEGMLLKSIVNSALRLLRKEPLEVAKHPVGMDEIVQDIEKSLKKYVEDDEQGVQILGIVGLGGSGKTTLATEVYNRKRSSIDRSSFLHDVRDAASRNVLHTKQKKLLEDFRIQTESFDNVKEGKAIIADRLRSLCVLIVLDDIDHEDQLDALLPPKVSLGGGSLIIITTREVDVLKSWGITTIYKIKPLHHLHAKQLFCWHAFLQPFPPHGFEDLVESFLISCEGLPLSLKVIGGQLYGKRSRGYWVSQLKKIQRILPSEILGRLKISYDAPEKQEQEVVSYGGFDKEEQEVVSDGSLDKEEQEVEEDMLSSSTFTLHQTQPDNAFDGLAPYYSASKSTEPWDIFVNHCWSAVKDTLATTIHDKLHCMGLYVFLDDNGLQFGDVIPPELQHAIATAAVHIAIFSPNYAHSPRCLTELSYMLKIGAKIIPIYYHVEPAALRWIGRGKGRYGLAFSEHENKGRYSKDKLDEWKCALHEISFLHSYSIKDNAEEQGVVEDLVDLVLQCPALKYAGGIQIMGIGGTGGSGKTTLAKEIYQNRSMFSRSSFLYNIRDATEKEVLLEKQKKLLCDLDVNCVSSDDVDAGKEILNSHLRSTSVLIILDDVDNTDQLDALLPAKESLGKGSLIIVTTRKPDVLKTRDISILYQMRGLKATDAKQLFCRHAFLQPFPLLGFETLVERFVKACNSIPLSLKVLGGNLFGESCKDRWKQTLKELSTVSEWDITGQLRLCFDALDAEDKEMFLDVACFFVGEKKSLAIEVWEGSGWDAQIGLDRLLTKCLVEVDDHDIIQMHDHLRDLGRDIARLQSPYRLWSPQQLDSITPQESFQIRGMTNRVSNAYHLWNEKIIKPTNFQKQPQSSSLGLKLLVCSAQFLNEEVGELSSELLWLRWNDFNHRNLPTWPSLQNLRVLELNGALNLQELWTDTEHAPLQLRELIIAGTWSASFEKFPNSISNLKFLKKIALLGGVSKEFSIKELPEEFCDLQSLEHLELRHCIFLSTLPTDFGKLRKLRHLDLYSCQMLRKLPISFKQLVNLEYLDLSGCKKLPFEPDILENMRKLKKLYFTGCPKLQELPLQIVEQKDLKELHLEKTTLKNVPENIGELSKLETLVIGSPHLTDFPESFRYLSSLIHLKIAGCINLNSFPESVKHLKLLENLCIKSSGLGYLPQGFRQLSNLQILKIFDCPIGELDVGSESSSSLPKLKVIHLTATDVTRLSISQDCCPSLETLQLELNRRLIEIDIFSTSVRMMKVSECAMLRNINGIPGLIKLETMEITGCPKLGPYNSRPPLGSAV